MINNKDINELLESKVITINIAEDISNYYKSKENDSSKLMTVFSILGSVLLGLGIILIVAHNWDEFTKNIKTIIAFLPLILGQISCGYVLYKKLDNKIWTESSAIFLSLSIGACISLISQIYNINGEVSTFLFTWFMLTLPIIYLMKSSIASLFYIVLVTYYIIELRSTFQQAIHFSNLLLLFLNIPLFLKTFQKSPNSFYIKIHSIILPISYFICFYIYFQEPYYARNLNIFLYISFYCLLILIGNLNYFSTNTSFVKIYNSMGILLTATTLLFYSSNKIWLHFDEKILRIFRFIPFTEFYVFLTVLLLTLSLLIYLQIKNKIINKIPLTSSILVFFIASLLSLKFSYLIPYLLVNTYLLLISVFYIFKGIKQIDIFKLNFGLVLISILIVLKFYENDISFVTRGLIFILLGIGFYFTNYIIIKKRS